ncbi:MAG: hypothetical protein PHE49_01615 [bacterium]|nr:hypothetical protein [bacterium]
MEKILSSLPLLIICTILTIIIGVFLLYLLLFRVEKESKSEKAVGYFFGISFIATLIIPPLLSGDKNEILKTLLLIGIMTIFGVIESYASKRWRINPLFTNILWLWAFWYSSYLITSVWGDSLNMLVFFSLFFILNFVIKKLLSKYKEKLRLTKLHKILIATVYLCLIFIIFKMLYGPYNGESISF